MSLSLWMAMVTGTQVILTRKKTKAEEGGEETDNDDDDDEEDNVMMIVKMKHDGDLRVCTVHASSNFAASHYES